MILIQIAIYCAPILIGVARGTLSSKMFWVNILLGWTVIGWIVALAWAIQKK